MFGIYHSIDKHDSCRRRNEVLFALGVLFSAIVSL